MGRRIAIFDTTLRDGTQGMGISLSLEDKLAIARRLDAFGVAYIEGGWPFSNPKDLQFFEEARKLRLKTSRIVAFGSTCHKERKASEDANLRGLVDVKPDGACIFGKSWDFHVREAVHMTLEENLRMIRDSVAYLRSHLSEVVYDAEHFFDGYRSDPEYALRTLQAAEEGGADWLVLCDTNGGSLPDDVERIVREVAGRTGKPLGIHAHNDGDVAVANSLAAVRAGATMVQGTINGVGERCGNANLCSILPTLQLKMGLDCVPPENLPALTELSRYVDELANLVPRVNQPYVGEAAFAHKGGMHVSAVEKNPKTYEHVTPESVGNSRRVVVSELAGRSNVVLKARELDLDLERNPELYKKVLQTIKRLEHEGWHFEGAEASFALLVQKEDGAYVPFFDLEGFRVLVERDAKGDPRTEATVRIAVKGERTHTAAEGDGPVNALDNAMRKALRPFFPELDDLRLVDYKVRIINAERGTMAKTRVLVTFRDDHATWGTVGVSENILEASWRALADAIEYKIWTTRRRHAAKARGKTEKVKADR